MTRYRGRSTLHLTSGRSPPTARSCSKHWKEDSHRRWWNGTRLQILPDCAAMGPLAAQWRTAPTALRCFLLLDRPFTILPPTSFELRVRSDILHLPQQVLLAPNLLYLRDLELHSSTLNSMFSVKYSST